MKVKMKVIAVTHDFMSLPYGHTFDLEEKMALELFECGYGVPVPTELEPSFKPMLPLEPSTPVDPEPEPAPPTEPAKVTPKRTRKKKTPTESKGE